MRHLQTALRTGQRISLDLRNMLRIPKIRYVLLMSILLVASTFVFFYKDESYEYTSGSLQMISDKINTLSDKIDNYRLNESQKKATMVHTTTSSLETTTHASIASTPSSEIKASATGVPMSISKSDLSAASPSSSAPPEYPREKAVIMIFARNADLYKTMETIWSIEQRFNKEYNYNYLIISDAMHTRNFKKNILAIASTNVEFHNTKRLNYPSGIDKNKIKDARKQFREQNISFRKTQRARHVQRFWASDIFQIEPLQKYDYFMRVDPGVLFYCDINYDPFKFMAEHDRTYGFGFALKGKAGTFPTLWENTLKYIEQHPDVVNENNMIDFISDDKGESFNLCQFKANFEVGDLRFFKSDKFKNLADYFDEKHGIYYEGWDESTIHTLAVVLLEDRRKIQFFNNIGYNDRASENLKSCPIDRDVRLSTNCICDPLDDLTWDKNAESCVEKFFQVNSFQLPAYTTDYYKARAVAEEDRKKEDEKRKYEQEQLQKEKEAEEAEKKKVDEESEKKEDNKQNGK